MAIDHPDDEYIRLRERAAGAVCGCLGALLGAALVAALWAASLRFPGLLP